VSRKKYRTASTAKVILNRKMATILFLAHRIPYPPNKGDKLRAYEVLNHWTKHHKVFLGCFVDDPQDLQHRSLLRELCAGTYFGRLRPKLAAMRACGAFLTQSPLSIPYYYDPGMAVWVSRTIALEKPDCIFVFSSVMGQYVPGTTRSLRILVDFVDVDSEKWAAYATTKTFAARQIYRREARELLRFDRRLAAKADANIFVSGPEAECFRKLAPEVREKVLTIPNGIDANYFSPKNAGPRPNFTGAPNVVFTGQMDYWPNVDAVVWFSENVLPKIREKFPTATFYIVGAHPSAAVRALGSRSGVVVTGKVADVRPYVGHADLIVAPMRIGRGIQNKVLEGMAMQRPVIVTPLALAGIGAEPDKHLLLARDSDELVRGVERVMNPTFAGTVAAAARKWVLEMCSWAECLEKYDRLLECNDLSRSNCPSLQTSAGHNA
jgi:sugar transferase (PEP-CTERM/EpsH1 system associated)